MAKNIQLTEPLRYDTPNDVSMRLDQTFIRYKNKIYWCRYSGENLNVRLYLTHNSSDGFDVHSSDVDLDVSSIRVGFLSRVGEFYPGYISRAPVRKYKQGICQTNLCFTEFKTSGPASYGPSAVKYTQPFYEMMKGNYPKWNKILDLLPDTTDVFSGAIDYDFCIYRKSGSKEIHLVDSSYDIVGVINKTTRKLTVNGWWSTPTMVELLQSLGVPLNE